MNVYDGLEAVRTPFAASSVAIGTFDGVHVGHQAIIRAAVEDARRHARPALVFTFDRHPAELFAPSRAPALLTTPEQRNQQIAELGVDGLVIAHFDTALAQLSPDDFVQRILKDLLGAKAVVEGANFCFGKDRAGNVAYLQAAQSRYDFTLTALEPVMAAGAPASSTRVREALRDGDPALAETILGHPYLLVGTIVSGQKLGRTLGYPTANLELRYRQVVPGDGIYAAVATLDDGRKIGGACSIGERPTVEGAGRSIETFLLDFSEDIYGQGMSLRFIEKLRDELRFDSLAALTTQMAIDVAQARYILAERTSD